MRSTPSIVAALAALLLQACGGSGGSGGTYTSVAADGLTLELKSGGTVVMEAAGLGSSNGTYVVDGEKILVTINGQTQTFIRDGDCIEDQNQMFGRLCKGGKAGEAANVTTRSVPAVPAGTYTASNADGEFKLEFKPDNKLTLSLTPPGGAPMAKEGTFRVEGDNIFATLDQSEPLVLKYVNGGYESTSFGLPMRFVKQ